MKVRVDLHEPRWFNLQVSPIATLSPVATLDEHGDIVGVNRAWDAFGDRNGLPEEYTSVGKNYLELSREAGDTYGDRVAAELRRLLTDEQAEFSVVYPCHAPDQERWFRLYATALSFSDDRYYLLVHRRLDRKPPPRDESSSEVGAPPTRSADHRDRGRLVTYKLSPDEIYEDALLTAFDAIGFDVQSRETTLQDWIDHNIIRTHQTSTSNVRITCSAWEYPVSLTPEEVTIHAPERSSE